MNGDQVVRLRPFDEGDLLLLERFATDPNFSQPFEWSGFGSPRSYRSRWEEDGFLAKDPYQLVVSLGDGTAAGTVQWRDPQVFGQKGLTWEIGAVLAPEHRGKGVGTTAQRLLADYLFDTTTVHRLCACTEVDNIAEQRSLEKAGFDREGLLRQAAFRGGAWRDEIAYARLRGEGPTRTD
jgi:RimJ/RimL family protein N-acetyltransferase